VRKRRIGSILFGLFFVFLLAASGTIIAYYLQISEPLNNAVDRALGRGKQNTIPPAHSHPAPAPPPTAQQTPPAPAIPYDYYLQIAALPVYDQAEKTRDAFVRKKIPAIVRRGFNARRKNYFYRVWLGPFPSAGAATEMRRTQTSLIPADAFLDSLLRSASTLPLSPGPPAATTPPQTKQKEADGTAVPAGYYIVLASLRGRPEAEKEVARLQSKGVRALVQEWQGSGRVWYRVQAGPYGSEEAARRELRTRPSLYGEEAFVSSRGR
jgi:cell division septation protein DedD